MMEYGMHKNNHDWEYATKIKFQIKASNIYKETYK